MHEKRPESQRSELGFFRSISRRWNDDKLMLASPVWLNILLFLVGLVVWSAQIWLALRGPRETLWVGTAAWWVQRALAFLFFGFVVYAEARGLILRVRRRGGV